MIISRTPLRITFIGGGTDFPSFYEQHGGCCLSATIDKYVYLAIHPTFDGKWLLKYSKTESLDRIEDIQHPLIRCCLQRAGALLPLEITSFSDIPASGSGLGSSSAFTVGLLTALYQGAPMDVAEQACQVEIDCCHSPIGKQDQYGVAYGGLKELMFSKRGVQVNRLRSDLLPYIQEHLLCFFTGITRQANPILKEQSASLPDKTEVLKKMADLAQECSASITEGYPDLLGPALHKNWLLKKQLASGISNPEIDAWYDLALKAGAVGGKVVGAGGGGFLLFWVPPEKRNQVRKALGLREFRFNFVDHGTQIVHSD